MIYQVLVALSGIEYVCLVALQLLGIIAGHAIDGQTNHC